MPEDSKKLYYSIGEVADIFHVNESLLRFWEKEFPTTIKPRKNAKGTRFYKNEDIESIRMIYFMVKEKGMTLAGARKRLKEEKKGMTAQFELAQRLKKIRSELLKLQEELGRSEEPEEDGSFIESVPKRMVFDTGSEEVSPAVVEEPVVAEESLVAEEPIAFEEPAPIEEPIPDEELAADQPGETAEHNITKFVSKASEGTLF